MELKSRLQKQLETVRNLSEGLLQAFQTPDQWTHQVDPSANHALWFAGHMALTDNFFLSKLDPTKAQTKEGYGERFGMGSKPLADPSAYPPVEEVRAYMRNRRQTLLEVLNQMSGEDLAKPVPEGMPSMMTDLASIFEMAVWHEALHAGQVSVARRSLGHDPLFAPKAK